MRQINLAPLIDVLLVLLVIFLVTAPVMIKEETLETPVRAETIQHWVSLRVNSFLSMTLVDDRGTKQSVMPAELAERLRPELAGASTPKVVYVDFDPDVPWRDVVETMDSIRSVATDVSHDEIQVALATL